MMDFSDAFRQLFDFKQKYGSLREYVFEGTMNPQRFNSERGYWRFTEFIGNLVYKNRPYDNFINDPFFAFLTFGTGIAADPKALTKGDEINAELMERFTNTNIIHETLNQLTSRHSMMLTMLYNLVGIDRFHIVEIGGGYGNFARMVSSVVGFNSWTIFDLTFVVKLQEYYLKRELDSVVRMNEFKPDGINLIDTEHRNLAINDIDKIDICIAIHSISELELDEFMWYYNSVLPKAKYFFYATQIENICISSKESCYKKLHLINKLFEPLHCVNMENGNVSVTVYKNRSTP